MILQGSLWESRSLPELFFCNETFFFEIKCLLRCLLFEIKSSLSAFFLFFFSPLSFFLLPLPVILRVSRRIRILRPLYGRFLSALKFPSSGGGARRAGWLPFLHYLWLRQAQPALTLEAL